MNEYIFQLYKMGKISVNDTFDELFNKNKVEFKTLDKTSNSNENSKELKLIIDELDNLTGLTNVKNLVDEIIAFIEIQQKRKENNLASEPIVLHMVFKGNPGTGKTTVARLIGKIFKHLGMLETGHLIEIERADIVGEYIGHTALKVKQQVKKAQGGILFIDEAYSLARGGEKDFGKEAIDALVKAMEDYKDKFILILAGYESEMNYFLRSNPGLKSRFPIHVEFKDYTTKELLEIAKIMANKRQYKLSNNAIVKLKKILTEDNNSYNSGNARLVRNIIERSIRKQALRLKKQAYITKDDLILLREVDIERDDAY